MNTESHLWLTRDSKNVIQGPLPRSEILQMIKKEQLKGKMEISQANSYWFAIEETAELARFFPELGLKAPEQPTQMTATLTQADVSEHGVDITKFTPSPSRKDLTQENAAPSPSKPTGEIQWLNEEFAEEFGEEMSDAQDSLQLEGNSVPAAAEAHDPAKRATVKADTLPSERHDYKGERPRPMNAVLKTPERAPVPGSQMVKMPVAGGEMSARILSPTEEAAQEKRDRAAETGRKKMLMLGAAVAGVAVVTAAFFLLAPEKKEISGEAGDGAKIVAGNPESVRESVRRALLLVDLDEAKSAIATYERLPDSRSGAFLPISQAIVKREFLFDADGALALLERISGAERPQEVQNLIAIYGFDRDPGDSVTRLEKISANDPVFRYNHALALLRNGEAAESAEAAGSLAESLPKEHPLAEDSHFLSGWARDVARKGRDTAAEASYNRALAIRPSAKAQLALALHRLRNRGLKESEGDFRAFIEAMPELDPPAEAMNYRRMGDADFYQYAREQIRELNLPQGAAGLKPSPLVMAVDAILSCLQSRTGEAGKILEGALSSAPGDANLLKAVGYHRWKEGRYPEILDLFKALPRDRLTYANHLLLGKALVQAGQPKAAEAHFLALVELEPTRGEAWALLGNLKLQLGQKEEAKQSLQKALVLDPFQLVALRGLDRLGVAGIVSPELKKNLPL